MRKHQPKIGFQTQLNSRLAIYDILNWINLVSFGKKYVYLAMKLLYGSNNFKKLHKDPNDFEVKLSDMKSEREDDTSPSVSV